MRESKSTNSLRPIDISYRNDLKNGVDTRADRSEKRTADWDVGSTALLASIPDADLAGIALWTLVIGYENS